VRHRRNLGQSAALVSGFERARGKTVVTLDADLQNDPADIPRLLAELDEADVICGVRVNRQDDFMRLLSSRIANSVRNRLTRDSITDVGCSLRVCRAEFLEHVPAFNGMHRFLPTLLKLNGARVKELDVSHRPRHLGTSKYGVGNRLWRGISDLFGVRWLQRRWLDRREVEDVTDELRDTRSPQGTGSEETAGE
ncbi:MAG: glycosyltransferase, partial [Acidobacteriota bacterium]|nr:glycosyltransferase [Acidobacteriota bacterium]